MADLTTYTCPDVKVPACPVPPPPPACEPKVEIHREYVGPVPHWCESAVCTGGEVFGALLTLIVLLAIGLAAYSAFNYFRNLLREHGMDSKKAAQALEKECLAMGREDAMEKLKIEQQRLNMIFADKQREDHRILAAARAKLDPLADPPPIPNPPG